MKLSGRESVGEAGWTWGSVGVAEGEMFSVVEEG